MERSAALEQLQLDVDETNMYLSETKQLQWSNDGLMGLTLGSIV